MTTLGNIKLKTLRDVAYESIKESIMKHELMPGETLTITNLSTLLGISPTPVREAVVRLSNEGILDYEANKRVKVSKIAIEDVSEIYEARRLIEVNISKKFVGSLKKNKGLKKKLEELKEETSNLVRTKQGAEHYAVIDLKLHELFLDLVGNGIMKELFYILGNKSLRIRTLVEATNKDRGISSEVLQNGASEHLAIIEALLSENENQVVGAMETHLINSEKRTLKYLDNYFSAL